MARTPEGKVKDAVKWVFQLHTNAYYHMPVQNGMGSPTLDFICCVPVKITQEMVGQTIGAYLAIETKAPGKKPTPRQEQTIAEITAAGGKVLVIDSADAWAMAELRAWLS